MKTTKLSVLAASILIAMMASESIASPPKGYCDVVICNKLQRFSLSPWSHLKDKIGEQCFPQMLPISQATRGAVLHSGTRFYQGGFNPTKRSVTKVKSVGACTR